MKTLLAIIVISMTAIQSFSQVVALKNEKTICINENGSEIESGMSIEALDYNSLVNMGINNDEIGEYKEAIACFNKAIVLDPNNPEAYDKRGISYLKLLKYQRAFKNFTTAIKLDPGFADAYNHRGITNYCLNRFVYALEDYTKAIQLNISYAKAYYNRGLVYIAYGETELAYKDLKTAYDLGCFEAAEVIEKYCSSAMNDFARN